MPKRVYTHNETFKATIEFANFSAQALDAVVAHWELSTVERGVIAQGDLPAVNLPLGAGTAAGALQIDLSSLNQATVATLRVSAPAVGATNSWKIWVVPPSPALEATGVVVTRSWADAQTALAQGKRVLFIPVKSAIRQRQETAFLACFWSPVYFPNQAGTMGLLINPQHPALADFPTAEHTDWQWWSLLTPSPGAVVLDQVNYPVKPIVQVVDAFSRNQKLALIFEAQVGPGHLLVCAADLAGQGLKDPMRRQMRASLVRYLSTANPTSLPHLTAKELNLLFQDVPLAADSSTTEWAKDLEPPPAKN
jgi:hypothetical protein